MRGSGAQPSLLLGFEDNVKEFGPVFGFYFGQTPTVVIADFEMLKEAFKSEQLAARPSIEPNHEMRAGTYVHIHICFRKISYNLVGN